MDVRDLTREQLDELKARMICDRNEEKGEGTSWGELASAALLTSDDEVFEEYAGFDFSDDDFFCTATTTSATRRYPSIEDLITHEIKPALDNPADFDLWAIANAVADYDGKGFVVATTEADFWQAVQEAQTPISKLEAWLNEYPWRRETDAFEPLMLLEQIKNDLQ